MQRLARDVHIGSLDPRLETRHVIGPEVEGAAAAQVETGLMPVTGEDSIPHRSLVQRKAHVRAAVVYRPHIRSIRVDGDPLPTRAHGHDTMRPELA